MIRGIIFDLDGVLVDAVDWHFTALNRSLHLFGFQLGRQEHDDQYDGLPTARKLELLSERKGLPRNLHAFISEMKQSYTSQIIDTECKLDAQKIELLSKLKQEGFLLGLASNCIRTTVDSVIQQMGIASYFDCVLSREDVSQSKPSPQIFHECMRRLGISPDECLILEDSKPGVEAARASQANLAVVKHPREVTLPFIRQRLFQEPPTSSQKLGVLEIVIPMAGEGQRFRAAGYDKPKPLIEVHGKPMIDWVVENVRPKWGAHHFTFLCNQGHLEKYSLAEHLEKLSPGCSIVAVPQTTEGAACTVLLASDAIHPNNELLLANSDQFVDASIDDFLKGVRKQRLDGFIMTFPATESKWSFAKLDAAGLVLEVAEKKPISEHATVGIYYFKTAKDFIDATQSMIRKNTRTHNEFYVCPVYNELIQKGRKVGIHPIAPQSMHGLGTPEDLQAFLHPVKTASVPHLKAA